MMDSSADAGMAYIRRHLTSISDSASESSARLVDMSAKNARKSSISLLAFMVVAAGAFVILPSMFSIIFETLSDASVLLKSDTQKNVSAVSQLSPINKGVNIRANEERLLGGLLLGDPKLTQHCHSRAQQYLYRKASTFLPSKILVSRLRQYEVLHRKCASKAKHFIQMLNSPNSDAEGSLQTETDCRFAVWIAWSGLGNRLMTLVATFLYALLTQRIVLVDRGTDMSELFCEPFPSASWFLPVEFPQIWLERLNESHPYRFGHLIDNGNCSVKMNISSIPLYSYVDLTHKYDLQDRRFFCKDEQRVLNQIRWLFLRSNMYFVPSLYLVPSLNRKLEELFPQREALFHLLARYLFHPTNDVWNRIKKFHDAYLSNADEIVGLQIRVFDQTITSTESITRQLIECVVGNKILPKAAKADGNDQLWAANNAARKTRFISVLVTSLHQGHYDFLREYYLQNSTEDDSLISVNLPSHEGEQKTDKPDHDKQALTEIFLLSFTDKLVTSSMSTFGYAAQGLAGIRPWILTKPGENSYHSFACIKALSVEPCFHSPPLFGCDCQGGRDPGKVIPYLKHCEDVHWGLKLLGNNANESTVTA